MNTDLADERRSQKKGVRRSATIRQIRVHLRSILRGRSLLAESDENGETVTGVCHSLGQLALDFGGHFRKWDSRALAFCQVLDLTLAGREFVAAQD